VLCIRPILTYTPPAGAYNLSAVTFPLQVRQNKMLRLFTNAPWFVRIYTLYHELQLKLLTVIFENECRRPLRTDSCKG
jgi:hypothetical protein